MKEPVGFFPTETYHSIPPLCVHHQGFEIIRRAHFPPTLVSSQLLESSLEPNWLPPMDTMADEWDWTFGTVKRTRLLIPIIDPFFHRNPAYSASSSLNFTPFMKDLQRDQTMKESNCYTGEHRTIFIGLRLMMTPTRRLVKFLFKPIKKTSPIILSLILPTQILDTQ